MISIGINYGSHESSAAICRDGTVIFAAAEERFTRVKQDSRFPVQAITAGLNFSGVQEKDVDVVALSWPESSQSLYHDLSLFCRGDFARTRSRAKKLVAQALSLPGKKRRFEQLYLGSFSPPRTGFFYTDHHAAHALSAFCMAPSNDSVCVVFDGRGTTEATTVWKLKDGEPHKLFERSFPDSIGVMYANVTRLLGFQPLSDEWKVMGLAAYGRPCVDLSEFLRVQDWESIIIGRNFLPANDHEPSDFELRFSQYSRRDDSEIEQKHLDFAASAQQACERAMVAYVEHAVRIGGSDEVCLAGGVALNCKANGEILRCPTVRSVAVQPAAGDDGTAVGAALLGSIRGGTPMRRSPQMPAYLGTEYGDEAIEAALKRSKLRYERPADLVSEVAGCLASDQLVGWYQGRMEFGPRALGGRSILASPTKIENRDRVNEAVKFRELWRPFAPAVMHEQGHLYFSDYRMSPHMILSFWATEYARQTIPAVVHADGSCRVQSVTDTSNPIFYDLLRKFSESTGVHVLMNTSFNLKGEPIVESPLDAVRTFYSSGLDLLAIGPFIVRK